MNFRFFDYSGEHMKKIIILLLTVVLSVSFSACSNGGETNNNTTKSVSIPETITESSTIQTTGSLTENQDKTTQQSKTTMNIKINNKDFTAEFYDNETAKTFADMLPLTLNMSELHGNEKYYYFDNSLPADSSSVDKINSGDIMLYGNDCLVLFYESFSNPYSYTKIGRISNPQGLAEAVGSGSVTVTFSLTE